MKLASLLTKDQIILEMQAKDHWPAIVELVDHLDSLSLLGDAPKEEILRALQVREDQISTGIGSGVAIPHAFSDNVDNVVAVFGRAKEGIDFEALDNAPVKFVLLFVVPKKDYHLHLQTLAAIAKLFNNCEVRNSLERAETAEEVLEIFSMRTSRNNNGPATQRLY